MHLLVNHSRESVQNRLVTSLYKRELFDELLQEDEVMAMERSKCKQLLDVYKQAFDIVNTVV
jgi:dynamin 1-like protein